MNLKSEKDDQEDDMEELGQRTSASFQKDLQAAVEEAINDEDEDEMVEEHVDQEDLTDENMHEATGGIDGPNVGGTTAVNTSGGGYRTIVVDNSTYVEEEQDHPEPPVEPVKFVCTTNIHSAGSSGGTKLINGELPVKRLRRDQVIYEGEYSSSSGFAALANFRFNLHLQSRMRRAPIRPYRRAAHCRRCTTQKCTTNHKARR